MTSSNLKDFNWEVKMAVASDSMSNVNEPLVSLQLSLAAENHVSSTKTDSNATTESTKEKVLELTREELAQVIDSLTEASDAIAAYTN
ncbi:uncharacterized protein LOC142341156 [Convolutriloba macropyga]|uniref:uncharacterized protein LOC142341156 n=1 Tax=Convolutriloba macropyga TaxID=536237 RepID=UPI003F52291C